MMNSNQHDVISSHDYQALMGLFHGVTCPVALAVSGGPDSMALAYCAVRWAKENNKMAPVALIVDHRLRPESEAEAQSVRDNLEKMGLFAEILIWDHPPVLSRVHVMAREARYRLLREACARHGASALLLAHHRDDQAETILERFAKGSGTDGLAGMAPDSVQDGLRLIRPFLGLEKTRLVATCAAHQIPFVTDPSNHAQKYARGRLRRMEGLLKEEGFSAERLVDLADRAREDRDALHFYAHQFLIDQARFGMDGVVRLPLAGYRELPLAVAHRALSLALRHIHHTLHPHPRRLLGPVCAALAAEESFATHSFGGCLISRGEKFINLVRELSCIQTRLPLQAGQTVLWDERWYVSLAASCAATDLVIKPLGVQSHDVLDALAPALRHLVPQGRVRAVLPALWNGSELFCIPAFDCKETEEKNHPAIAILKSFPIS